MGTEHVTTDVSGATDGIPPVPPGFSSARVSKAIDGIPPVPPGFSSARVSKAIDGIPPVPPGFSSVHVSKAIDRMPPVPPGFSSAHVSKAIDGIPPVPPGFSSLTSFTLKRVQDGVKASANASCRVHCMISDEKSRKNLRYRPWVNYSEFDNGSGKECDYEAFEQDIPSTPCLPKGVIRGCTECKTCQKVIARWHPQDACKPTLDEAPVFYPSEEEFRDTLEYISSVCQRAEKYGICRIVPPSSWRPHCLLKEKNVWENLKFTTRVQPVDKLQNRDSLKKINGNHNIMRTKKQKHQELRDNSDENITKVNRQRYHNSSERFGFETGPDFTLETFQKYADDFKEQYFHTNADFDVISGQQEPSVENIEGEYWRIVEKSTEEIEVLYGADLDTGVFGSGFPKASFSLQNSEIDDQHINSGWNLNNLARLPGSMLCFESGEIPGVLVPWLYIGMCFSSFCWHVEDHHLYSLNYLHWGSPKIWYGVPGKYASKLEDTMKKHLPDQFEEQPDLLHNLVTQFSPSLLRLEGVPVYRCVQRPGEFVLTFPRAYHAGFNCGFNCAEAVNVAPLDWLPHGQNAVELYREQGRKISISHDKLLLGAAREAVRAHWNLLFFRKNPSVNARWKKFCSSDGILAKTLKARIEMECMRRKYLCSSRSQKMDTDFDSNNERECVLCHYDLHLSAASCLCSPDRFACLIHAKNLCSCAWNTRIFLFRYDTRELNVLLDALGGKPSAVHRWGSFDLGLSLSSYISREKTHEPNLIGMTDKEGREQKDIEPVTREPSLGMDKNFDLGNPNMTSSSFLDQQLLSEGPRNTTLLQNNSKSMGEVKKFSSSLSKISGIELIESSAEKVAILLNGNEHKGTNGVVSDKMTAESPEKNTDMFSRQTDCDDKTTSHAHKDKILLVPQTNVLLANEKDLLAGPEVSRNKLKVILVDDDEQVEENCREVLSNLHGQQLFEFLPGKESECVRSSARVTVAKQSADMLPENEASDCGTEPIHLQIIQNYGRGEPEDKRKKVQSEFNSEVNLDRSNSSTEIQPCTQRNLDICNYEKMGPQMEKVVKISNCNIEVLVYGIVLSGKLWSTCHRIFPKGYRSRVKYISILDPTQMCYYISEILDAGLLGPLFMVVVEQCPSEVFLHVSATKCWDMVRERVNQEIQKQQKMATLNLPSLQPPGSVDGLEMFGLLSPAVIQAIEELDCNHVCTEYWTATPNTSNQSDIAIMATDHRPSVRPTEQHTPPQPAASKLAVRCLFKKANPEELHALRSLLPDNDLANASLQELVQLINDEIACRLSRWKHPKY
ncbi:putative lysine-specific demethylase JMJ16 isoform X1 [Musa acuminata AAA Group]|uniref:putative lysine-specific demethylase JMJ16 isoform X1 n=1 Tax=Musa acuminata AAA Group TaxID=214697 RepID=UPI0031DD6623